MEAEWNALLSWKAALVVAWFALFFAGERLRPSAARPDDPGYRRLGRNAGLWLINVAISPLVVVPSAVFAAGLAPDWRPEIWAGWPGLLLDLLILDGLIYWWHRANHRIAFLWRFHEVHHIDRFLDTTSALRFHFGEVLLSALFRAIVVVLLALPIHAVLIFELLVLAAAIFHHSNLRLPPNLERALSLVVITPSLHWVHHHAKQPDTDSNYGTIFSFWDRLFASRNPQLRWPDMTIGVEGRGEKSLPQLVVRPFLPERRRSM